jgi:hypothetical protein
VISAGIFSICPLNLFGSLGPSQPIGAILSYVTPWASQVFVGFLAAPIVIVDRFNNSDTEM